MCHFPIFIRNFLCFVTVSLKIMKEIIDMSLLLFFFFLLFVFAFVFLEVHLRRCPCMTNDMIILLGLSVFCLPCPSTKHTMVPFNYKKEFPFFPLTFVCVFVCVLETHIIINFLWFVIYWQASLLNNE